MSEKTQIERLRWMARGWRGSRARVGVARLDALALGLEVPGRMALIRVPAADFCAAVDALAAGETAETRAAALDPETPEEGRGPADHDSEAGADEDKAPARKRPRKRS